MGTLKIEIDLPDFKNEVVLNLTIKKDGEIIKTISSPSNSFKNDVGEISLKEEIKNIESNIIGEGNEKINVEELPISKQKKKPKPTVQQASGGNMMNLTI